MTTSGFSSSIYNNRRPQQTFVVSRKALEDHFGLALAGFSPEDRADAMLGAFMHGWERIRGTAARSRRVPSIA